MSIFKEVHGGPVPDFPKQLTCGECSATCGVAWEYIIQPDGELVGAWTACKCPACGAAVVGLLAQDEEVMSELRSAAERSFHDS